MKSEPTDIPAPGLALVAWNQERAKERPRPKKVHPEPEPVGKAWGTDKSLSERKRP